MEPSTGVPSPASAAAALVAHYVVPPATRRPCRSSAVLTAARSVEAGGHHRQPQMAFDDAQHLERGLDRGRVGWSPSVAS